ncbi:toll-like receptor 2 type-2 [Megalops cyprinoides]|uniref:toll-like receptor 2 type-2 n=1 Tax=Megalops cyprinoides TaxID=118141 RepID=UPI0018645CA0|nr:toll-like receptor 2 type-2 [Megalops cyprinoides]
MRVLLAFPLFQLLLLCQLLSHCVQHTRTYCQRYNERYACDCSAEKRLQVPDVPWRNLILSFNLSFNHIQNIAVDDFSGYVHLKMLYLQNNRIQSIHDRAFTSTVNLERLDLSYNQLTNLLTTWFDQLFSLRHLNLLGNKYQRLGQGFLFQKLAHLKTLQFGNPSLSAVVKKDTVGLKHLEELVLHGSALKQYEEGSLGRLGPIARVTLVLRELVERDSSLASKILRDVSSPETLLVLTNTTLISERSMMPFQEVKLKGVKKVALKYITITDSAITGIMKEMDRSNLSYFAMEDSTFSGHGNWYADTHLPHLETVFIKNLNFQYFYEVRTITYLTNILPFLKRVTAINCKLFGVPCETSKVLIRLEYLDMSGNFLTDPTMRETACGGEGAWQQLRTLNVSKNSLRSLVLLGNLFTNLHKLESLDLSQNVYFDMPERCAWPSSLHYLNLSASQLRKVTSCLPGSLHILDLSNNDLTVFDVALPFLKELLVSGNKFKSLPPGRLYPSLKILSIHRNALNMFSSIDLKEYIKLEDLKAGYNSFVCSCEFVAFLQFDVGHLVTLSDGRQSYICDSPVAFRGELVRNVHLSIFECHMKAAVSVLCAGFLLLFLVCGILCYRFNTFWYVRMTWIWLLAKRKPAINRRNDICYDAFVSYSERDSEWVEEFLVQELESTQPPFRLCLHRRNFLPGKWIADNIIDAIEKSRRTLFVLSNHFVSSEWCKYELDFSHFRLFDKGDDTAILVLLEPIDKETIPKRLCKLRKIMNSRTYLEWPEDEAQRSTFWCKLKAAMNSEECEGAA